MYIYLFSTYHYFISLHNKKSELCEHTTIQSIWGLLYHTYGALIYWILLSYFLRPFVRPSSQIHIFLWYVLDMQINLEWQWKWLNEGHAAHFTYVTESCTIKPSFVSDLIASNGAPLCWSMAYAVNISSMEIAPLCVRYCHVTIQVSSIKAVYLSLSWQIFWSQFKKKIPLSILTNVHENYRPITLSSTHSKLIEMLIMPEDELHDTQFGFRESRGTSMPCVHQWHYSPSYICSLDAERWFDSIWHDALLYKLWEKLPPHHWLLMYRWYNNLNAVVR